MKNHTLPEMRALTRWLGKPPRSPKQLNTLNQADCELIPFGNKILALTTDAITDEISFGLYKDPYTWGWMCGLCSLSDLSAVAATPTGLLFSAQWGDGVDIETKKKVARGLNDCLKKHKTFLLGGDSGISSDTVLTSTGIGEIAKPIKTRMGAKPGDLIIAIGKFGSGPALGYRFLLHLPERKFPEKWFRPNAQIQEAQKIKSYISAIMDTSDGLAATVYALAKLNGLSFQLDDIQNIYESKATQFCTKNKLPLGSLFFADHGDYQLIVAARPKQFSKVKGLVPTAKVIGKLTRQSDTATILNAKGVYEKLDLKNSLLAQKSTLKEIHAVFKNVVRYTSELESK